MKKFSLLFYVAAALIVLRIILLPITPPGFFLDEAATGAHVVSMLHDWTNARDVSWPLFSESLGGGYTTPVYLYPLVGWSVVVGTSELALRYFSVVATILAVLIVGYSIKLWIGKRAGLIAIIAGLALPWSWLQGSLAWDPALVPLLVAGALLAFSELLFTRSRTVKAIALIGLPVCLIGLAYLYPPMRVTAPLLFAAAYIVLLRRNIIGARALFVTCLGAVTLALPLALFMFQPEALSRSQALSVFHDTSLIHGLWLACVNFFGLINPLFLFVSGDPNLRHSTGVQGMLGLAVIPPLVALFIALALKLRSQKLPKALDHNSRLLIWIGLYGAITSLLGSALTNEGQPHSLRATATWVFVLIIVTIGWQLIASSWVNRRVRIACIAIFAAATSFYVLDLTVSYPTRSASSFDTSQRQAIYEGRRTPGYPNLARRYYETR